MSSFFGDDIVDLVSCKRIYPFSKDLRYTTKNKVIQEAIKLANIYLNKLPMIKQDYLGKTKKVKFDILFKLN